MITIRCRACCLHFACLFAIALLINRFLVCHNRLENTVCQWLGSVSNIFQVILRKEISCKLLNRVRRRKRYWCLMGCVEWTFIFVINLHIFEVLTRVYGYCRILSASFHAADLGFTARLINSNPSLFLRWCLYKVWYHIGVPTVVITLYSSLHCVSVLMISRTRNTLSSWNQFCCDRI